MTEADIQEIAMTLNLTPRKCLGFRSPVEAFLAELGKDLDIRFHRHVVLRARMYLPQNESFAGTFSSSIQELSRHGTFARKSAAQ
jgi:hypothetical protein